MTFLVNGEKIEDSMIQQEVERLRPDYEKAFKDQSPQVQEAQMLDWSRENVIENTLLKHEAEKYDGQIREDEVETLMARLKEQYDSEAEFYKELNTKDNEKAKEIIRSVLKLDLLFEDIYKDLPGPSKEAVLEFYEENKEQFKTAEQVRVGHIVKHIDWQTDEATAFNVTKKAQEELKSGAAFEMLVEKFSDCPDNGGDLGFITRGEMVEEFEDVVFNLGVGEISGIFRTRFGFHITKLYDRKPAVILPLKQLRDQVVKELKDQMRNKAIDDFVDQLKSKAKIEEI